jgi:phosphotransferase system HPr (HPr) family protein
MSNCSPSCQTVKIVNPLGLHARAAGKLVNLTDQFKATVTLEKNNQIASSDSVMELMMLTASLGDTITINATGPEADEALKAIVLLVEEGFGEDVRV